MPSVLITGAGRGLGLEFVRKFAADGWRVIATCRDATGADAIHEASAQAEVHSGLDVTDADGVEALADALNGDAIDVLLNNAGIYGPRPSSFGDIDYAAWEDVLRVNTMGPLRLCTAFVENVARSERKQMVTISSVMGSVGGNDIGGAYVYRSSKAALNAVMKSLSIDLAERAITVVVMHPGWVSTDMGGAGAAIDPVTSVDGMHRVIDGLTPDMNGSFFNHDGTEIPW